MLLIICRWAWWVLGTQGFLALVWSAWGLRPRRRLRCPGPAQRWWALLIPLEWWPRNRCGYDLGALAPGSSARCPECGGAIRWRRARHPLGSVRLVPVALVVLLAARSAFLQTHAQRAHYARAFPTTLLIFAQSALGPRTPTQMRAELRERSDLGTLPGWQVRLLIPLKIRDLRDDDIRWNSFEARDWLMALGAPALPALRRALCSDDYQQRQLAADTLRRLADPPTLELIRVTVEGLRHDEMHRACVDNAENGLSWLLAHSGAIEPELRDGLASADAQERLICAGIVCLGRIPELYPAAVPLLIEHLADNLITDDAKFAAAALYNCGEGAIPYLEPATESLEPQTRALSRHILRNLTLPTPVASGIEPGPYAAIVRQTTRTAEDPIGLDPTWFSLEFDGLSPGR